MTSLRLSLFLAFAWLCTFFNIERVIEPINLSSVAYILAGVLAVGVGFVPALQVVRLRWILATVPPALLLGRYAIGYAVGIASSPLIVTELACLTVTVLLVRSAAICLSESDRALSIALFGNDPQVARPFEAGQSRMYAEVRRARNHTRPLTLVTAMPVGQVSAPVVEELTCRFREQLMKRYIDSEVARVLAAHLGETDVLSLRDDHFVAVMPERDRDVAQALIAEVADEIHEKLGLELRAGTAYFPNDELTLDMLLERAEKVMRGTITCDELVERDEIADPAFPALSKVPAAAAVSSKVQRIDDFDEGIEGVSLTLREVAE